MMEITSTKQFKRFDTRLTRREEYYIEKKATLIINIYIHRFD